MVTSIHGKHLLNDNPLGLLIGRGPWERDRQDAILHLGLDILRLTRSISIQRRE